jgi:predicted NAD/FAD-dependent oxidoreductase
MRVAVVGGGPSGASTAKALTFAGALVDMCTRSSCAPCTAFSVKMAPVLDAPWPRWLGPCCVKLIPAAGISMFYEACKKILVEDKDCPS